MDLMRFLMRPLPAGRIFGIPVLVVPAVLVLTLAMLASAGHRAGGAGLWWMATVLAILALALLAHELGHALVARRLGVAVLDITIWPLGGMARMQDTTFRPWIEGPVALAGPAVNLLLAAVLAPLPGPIAAQALWVNLVLGLGNLLPAFPLDGGRVLRAWLARNSSAVDATRAAVSTATGLTLAVVAAGFWLDAPLLALLLGAYIWWSGHKELLQLILRTGRLPVLPVGEVFRRALRRGGPGPMEPPGEPPAGDGRDGLEQFHGSLDEYFRRRRPPV